MNLTILTQPEFEPVALSDVYGHLRLDPEGSPAEHADDVMLARHITTARREVEKGAHRSLVRQKLQLSTSSFGRVALLRPPLISVESVQYYDASNQLQTVDSEDWYVTDDVIPELKLTSGMLLTTYDRSDAVRVIYWAGYPVDSSPGTTRAEQIANVPSEAKDAILLGVQLLYESLTPQQRANVEAARKSIIDGLAVYEVV